VSSYEIVRVSIHHGLARCLAEICKSAARKWDLPHEYLKKPDTSSRVGFADSTGMSPYNDTWKIHRKTVTKVASSKKSIAAFDRAQEIESAHFLLNVLDSPGKLLEHLQKEAGSVVLRITYGYTTVAHGVDPLVEVAAKSMHDFSISTVPGIWMVDYLPFRRYRSCYDRYQLMRNSEICSGLASRH